MLKTLNSDFLDWEDTLKAGFYCITQFCRIKGCGGTECLPPPSPPPPNNFRKNLSYPNKLYIVGKVTYRRVRIILNIGKIYGFRDFMTNFLGIVEI